MADATQYIYPNYWEPLTQNASNYAAGLPQQIMGTYNNWYDQPLAAGPAPNTQQANTMAAQPSQWTPQIQQASQTLQAGFQPTQTAASSMYQQGSTYDPSQLGQFLNPYIQDAAQATTNASNRNLMENILPNVNSTFTGAGQFGSMRNADFSNRAIRDQQKTLTDSLGNLNYGAYTTANQLYSDWANKGLQAAQGMSNLGQNQINFANAQGSLAGAGANLDQQQLTNLMTTGKSMQDLQQTAYDKNYADWTARQNYPVQQMGGLSQIISNMSRGVQPDIYSPSAQTDLGTQIASGAGLISSGLNNQYVRQLLGLA